MVSKRTEDQEIQEYIEEVRAVINGGSVPEGWTRSDYLAAWSERLTTYADELKERPDYGGRGGDWSVLNWPEKLRGVADEAERASIVFDTPSEDRTPEEKMYPGMVREVD